MLCQSCALSIAGLLILLPQFVAIENVATDVPLCVNFDSAFLAQATDQSAC